MAATLTSAVADFRQIALETVRLGIRVVPIPPREKACKLPEWQKKRSSDIEQIEKWARENPTGNCGAVADLDTIWVLDDDTGELADRIEHETGDVFPLTRCVRTAKGRHHYFLQNDASRAMGNRKVAGLFDSQVSGKYVVAAGSIHPSGVRYEVLVEGPITEAPAWLIEWVITASTRTPSQKSNGKVHEGGRDEFLFSEAVRLRNEGLTKESALRELITTDQQTCSPPMGERVCRAKIDSAFKYKRQFHLTDAGNTERLHALHGRNVIFDRTAGKYRIFKDGFWSPDENGEIYRLAKDVPRELLREAPNEADSDKRTAKIRFALQTESKTRLDAMVALLRHELGITKSAEVFDRNPLLLKVANGTLDLATRRLRDDRSEDLISKQSPVIFDAAVRCPVFDKFLNRIFAEDQELIRYVARACGYSLTGLTREHCLFVCHGTGRNGKTTLLEILRYLLGAYAQAADIATFMTKSGGSVRNDLARLRGARLISASENEEGQRLAENVIKQFTGGDVITARFLYCESFEYQPSGKLWMAVNHKPVVRGSDAGFWSRMRLIPFTVFIPADERDRNLLEKLKKEASGILNWALAGLSDYFTRGSLEEPVVVDDATSIYRAECDVLAEFLSDTCLVSKGVRVGSSNLYAAYKKWAAESGEWAMSLKRFRMALQERGFDSSRKGGKGTEWLGLGLRNDNAQGEL